MINTLLAIGAIAMATVPSSPQAPVAKSGKYVVELRVPEQGAFAGEEIDIEFRVMDSTKNDEILGMAGIPNVKAEAVITMPSMPGMPEAKPTIHTEGVPGDYGIEAFFPHGGEYRIDLSLTPPNEPTFKVAFNLNVMDEKPSGKGAKPFTLQVVEGNGAQAGKAFNLKLRVRDERKKTPVTAFDIAHEKRFHLLLASKDFGWFLHEHPEMAADGTWSVPIEFPASGEYHIYGDVAPVGKGSQILSTKIKVLGKGQTWKEDWTLSSVGTDKGVTGRLASLEDEIPVGRSTVLKLELKGQDGKPIGDTQPWLGAAGHMMIFSKDGQTVVHSHPAEGAESAELVRKGEMRFTGRFPKAGVYRVFAQFQRNGVIHTLPFTIEVKG